MIRLSPDQARRAALGAQAFNDPRPGGRVDVRHFRKVIDRLGVVQLDSVNVFSRTHYMPFFSRLGEYDRDALDRWLWRSGEIFEYWGHEASLIPARNHRLFRWRMEGGWHWQRVERLRQDEPGYMEGVLAEVKARGPLQTRDLEDPGDRDRGSMWGWSKGKVALEALFLEGKVTVADRSNFVRLYDLPERVLRTEALDGASPRKAEAQAALLELAARSLGVATAADLADYYRIKMPEARPIIARLVNQRRMVEVEVEGWRELAYMRPDAVVPRRIEGRALLSPFDSLIWFRPRTERLWDFHYRIEIYVPEPKRVYGYYVLPFLLDGALVGRVDLKSDRATGRLLVRGAWGEPGIDKVAVGRELAAELEATASWLGLAEMPVAANGDLADHLTVHT